MLSMRLPGATWLAGVAAEQVFQALARVAHGLGGLADHVLAGIGRGNERGLPDHRAQEVGQRRIDARENARGLDVLVEPAHADEPHVGQQGLPLLHVLLQVQAAHAVGQRAERGHVAQAVGGVAVLPEHPRVFVGQQAGEHGDLVLEALVIAVVGEHARHALGQRLAADALEHQRARGAGGLGHAEARNVLAGALALQAAEHALLQRVAREHGAHAAHQVLVHLQRRARRALRNEHVELVFELLALVFGNAAVEVARPVERDPGLQRLGVEVLGLVEHQVALERLVGVLEVVLLRGAQLVLDALGDLRQEGVVERALVREHGGRVELVALVEAQRHRQRLVALAVVGRLPDVAQALQHGRDLDQVLHARGQRGQVLLRGLDAGLDRLQVVEVLQRAVAPGREQADGDQRHRGDADHAQRVAAALQLHVGAGQALLGEHHLAQQRGEEVAAPAALLRREHRALDAEAARQAAHHAVDGAALLRAAGEVHAAHPRRLREARAGEHLLQQVGQQRADGAELRRKTEDRRAARAVGLALHARDEAVVHAVVQQRELAVEGGGQAFLFESARSRRTAA
jgi:hypothetical protein